ncbi:hypothetical protein [Nonomuraea sp. NPDC005650]|uniref:hypothetical protein n=1 Tax=Nonomuraea sp. NPDC005650 TaxID=3157045 RepID=UPI0033B0230D
MSPLRMLAAVLVLVSPLAAVFLLPIAVAGLVTPGNIYAMAVAVLVGLAWAWAVGRAFLTVVRAYDETEQAAAAELAQETQA